MSQENDRNVDVVAKAIEVFNRRDMAALADLSEQDLEIVSALTAANLGGSKHFGQRRAWTDYFAAMDESWDEWGIEDADFRDAGGEQVVCRCRLVGKGKNSGVPVERTVGIVFRLKSGRLWRIRSYLDPAEALAAVGLAE
jgi:ketosteroid isomerase-like protein